jgi:ribosomal-protein-alanine N-acetyltransferase
MIDYKFGVTLEGIRSTEDIDTLFELRNNPLVWRWCRQRGPLHYDAHLLYWSNIMERDESSRFYLVKNMGNIIGCAGFTSINHINSRAEFSLYIDPSIQGVGLGEAALKTLFSFGFNMLNFNSIWGESYDENPAMKLFEKIGMKKEGIRRQFYFREGKYLDAHLYGILRSEFTFL